LSPDDSHEQNVGYVLNLAGELMPILAFPVKSGREHMVISALDAGELEDGSVGLFPWFHTPESLIQSVSVAHFLLLLEQAESLRQTGGYTPALRLRKTVWAGGEAEMRERGDLEPFLQAARIRFDLWERLFRSAQAQACFRQVYFRGAEAN
jgi:hypothetical protein